MVEATGAGQGACDDGWSTGITADSSSVDEFESLNSVRFNSEKPLICGWNSV